MRAVDQAGAAVRGWTIAIGAGLAALGLAVAGCGSPSQTAAAAPPAAALVQLSAENVVTASLGTITSGPRISGQLTPAREATVRAQSSGSVVALPADRGQRVLAGQEIARISSRDLEASYQSTQVGVKAAEGALSIARSEEQRTENLVKGGALAARDLEQAKNAVSNAEAQLAAAQARQKSAWQQLDDTSMKAPFAGIVTARPANIGDVVSQGTELLTIIDPSSLQLEALVPSERMQEVHAGDKVSFTIRGAAGNYTGVVQRLSASADPVTRQVSIFVSLPNNDQKLIAGLFAEGRVQTAARKGVIVPLAAVDETGPTPTVTRISQDKAERVTVELGARQDDTEQVEVTKGVAAGDVLIVGSAKGVAPGTPVTVVK